MANPAPEAALAQQIATLRYDDLPAPVVTVATQCLLDVLGVTIAGASEPTVARLRDTLWATGIAPGKATVVGDGRRTRATEAALLNGTAGHALDFDDVAGAISAHPSVAVFPAVLALAEECSASGRALLTAFVAGYETEVRVGLALGTSHYARGFHTTATVGALGAAAAAAHLLELDAAHTATALGIAATQTGGLKGMFGTDCKPFHAGRASSAGVLAAQLAAGGFTATPGFLSHPQTMGDALSEEPDSAQLTVPFADRWHVPDTLFKAHAACYLTHGAIEAALALRSIVAPADVDRIEVRVPPGHLAACNILDPQTRLQAKFSLRFVTAAALSTGRTDESTFDDARLWDDRLRLLAARVDVVPDSTVAPYAAVLTATTRDGGRHRLSRDTGRPRWTRDPAEQQDLLVTKFRALVEPVFGPVETERLLDALADLPRLARATDLLPQAGHSAPTP
ncbi:MmgE/PrpD family protein [Pseudonocardia kujensis]|nr:MmgE/PrpD family protein [Pseudonocardia kujensis]MCE0761923.1 MmgE/PrpD family protein [Pseudonocardia kujensis]